MKKALHAIILLLILTVASLPLAVAASDRSCPEPPNAAYEAIGLTWPEWVAQMEWKRYGQSYELFVGYLPDEPMKLWNERYRLAQAMCTKVRQTWNPDCDFKIYVYDGKRLADASADCPYQSGIPAKAPDH